MNANILAAITPIPSFNIPTPQGGLPGNPSELISMSITWAVILALLVTLAMVVWGGFDYIMSGEDVKKTAAARQKITNGLVGMIIVAATWIIFKFMANFFQVCTVFGVC